MTFKLHAQLYSLLLFKLSQGLKFIDAMLLIFLSVFVIIFLVVYVFLAVFFIVFLIEFVIEFVITFSVVFISLPCNYSYNRKCRGAM